MKTPPFLTNLYRDLQDRRLLPLVAILLIAIPALPIVLGQGSEEPATPPPPAAVAEDEDIPTLPAVLASDPGLRDYRKRLDSLDSKDPFAQQFSGPSEAAAEAASVSKVESPSGGASDFAAPSTASIGGSTSATLGSASTSTGASTSSGTSTSSSAVSTSGGSTGGSTNGSSSGSGPGGSPDSDGQWFTYRIDVTTGRAGDAEERKDVKRGTVLPSQSNPVALFLGVGEGGNRASFLVSSDVVRTHGEGTCLPSPSDCQILTLKQGHERKFEYAPRGEPDTYVIKLDAIRLVEIDVPGGSDGDSGGKASQSAHGGLKSFLGL